MAECDADYLVRRQTQVSQIGLDTTKKTIEERQN